MTDSPCGWYSPDVVPAMFAHFLYFALGRSLRSFIATRMRRWDGFKPSRTSGRARAWMTLSAYVRYDSLISRSISRGWTRFSGAASVVFSESLMGGRRGPGGGPQRDAAVGA